MFISKLNNVLGLLRLPALEYLTFFRPLAIQRLLVAILTTIETQIFETRGTIVINNVSRNISLYFMCKNCKPQNLIEKWLPSSENLFQHRKKLVPTNFFINNNYA